MEDYLCECGYMGIFEPHREPHRRIVTINNINSLKEKFLQKYEKCKDTSSCFIHYILLFIVYNHNIFGISSLIFHC